MPEHGVHARLSDAELAGLLCRDTATAYPALRELRLRHGEFLTAYARLCTTDDAAARRLVTGAFTLAARESGRGIAAPGALRHQLLLLIRKVAASWAADDSSAWLSAEFVATEAEPPLLLGALRTLPLRIQAVLWYALVDEESDERTALFLGVSRGDVLAARDSCLGALRRAFLGTYLARYGDAQCQGYSRLIENATSPENPRHSVDLAKHLVSCDCCERAHTELRRLLAAPREALADGLLAWAGVAYARESRAAARGGQGGRRGVRAGRGRRAGEDSAHPSRRVVLGSAALGVAVAPLLLIVLTGGGPDRGEGHEDVALPPAPAPSATVTVTPSPSSGESPQKPPDPTPTKAPKPPAPQPALQDGRFTQMVNAETGYCLTVEDGLFKKGTDVVAAPCGPSDTQRWRLDANRGVIVSYGNEAFCLDSRGEPDNGVGIWECAYVEKGTPNLTFTVDARGTVRPVIALDHALTSTGGEVTFAPVDVDRGAQRWEAGLEPV